jgi:hypothetical protein
MWRRLVLLGLLLLGGRAPPLVIIRFWFWFWFWSFVEGITMWVLHGEEGEGKEGDVSLFCQISHSRYVSLVFLEID